MTRFTTMIAAVMGLLLTALVFTTPAQPGQQPGSTARQNANSDALSIALAHLEQNRDVWGLTAADLAEVNVTDVTVSRLSGVTAVYLEQQLDGIAVFNGLINISVMPHGDVLAIGNRFVSDLAGAVSDRTASITAAQAVQTAAAHLGLPLQTPLQTIERASGAAQETVFNADGISQNPIPARLVYDASGNEVRLAWNVIIYQLDGLHWWNVRVDANTGDILSQNDWVVYDHFELPEGGDLHGDQPVFYAPTPVADGSSYRVFHLPVESPSHASPPAPADGRTLQDQPADAIGSPFGWHDTDGVTGPEFTTTQGNNVHAYTDIDGNGIPDPGSSPDGGPDLDFDFPLDLTQPPGAYRPASVTNLFHWNNLMHDVSYRYGFDEIHGNFQENNYDNGGLGSDYVNAEAQDGMGTNCGNFATPPDGANPRMQMCVWTAATPQRDGALDNGIVAHEYGHGIASRMVGGPSNVSCLNNAEAMLEGWADWQALIMTMENGDLGADQRGIGTYVLNQPPTGGGLRPAPYTTDMTVNSYTYADLPGVVGAHGVGFVWATMLWEMNWALINAHGFDEDLYPPDPPVNTWSGNQLAHALVTEALNLTPCGPGFVDGRNAILNADMALTGGENQCPIWAAFAKRGLGFSASQGSPNNTNDGTAAFDTPLFCQGLDVTPTSQDICQGETAVYTVGVGEAFRPPVTLSATGNPAPSSASFEPNPVTAVPATTELTIANTGAVAAGSYTLNILGGDGTVTDTLTVDLTMLAGAPDAAPVLTAPPDGSSNVPTSPTLIWNPTANTSHYHIEIATDATFSSIVYMADEQTTTHNVAVALAPDTGHYWRVTAVNSCGSSPASTAFSFTTANIICATPQAPIPDNNPAGVNGTITIPISGAILDMDIMVNATHPWVGDLIFTVSHNGTAVTIIDRPGHTTSGFGCPGDDIDVTVNDEGPHGNIETQCANAPAIFGDRVGGDPPHTGLLAAFDGLDIGGSWTLNVSDAASGQSGTLVQWCVAPTLVVESSGVTLSPDQAASGAPGSAVTYTLSISNTGNTTDTFSLSTANDNGWLGDLSASNIMLAAGAREAVLVTVHVPTTAANGEINVTTVTAVSGNNPAVTDNVTLVTTATAVIAPTYLIYLPAILRPEP
ncbi:MAG: hypothetical protein HND44_14210 [Chloroflexi bacterium]|nr:hypothetical protein [Ardenticatenaceae bacterium]NOG35711.1 hypothetical protein [Chloroflexota bacterium]GIK55951.1 MAG: hypothetical protein BroJett015_16140 [Chloroflexota bacterium]